MKNHIEFDSYPDIILLAIDLLRIKCLEFLTGFRAKNRWEQLKSLAFELRPREERIYEIGEDILPNH